MTANQMLRELSKRKEPLKDFLVKLLVDAGVVAGKEVIVEKEKVVIKTLTTEEEDYFKETIEGLEETLKAKIEHEKDLIKQTKELLNANKGLEEKVKRELSEKDRKELRISLENKLNDLIKEDPKTAADKFMKLQSKIASEKDVKAKLKTITTK